MALDRTYADTRLLGMAGATCTETLAEVVDKMDDMCGLFAEHVIAGYIASRAAVHELRVDRFPEKPLMVGISGSTGSTYRGEWKPATRLRGLIENRLAAIASRKQV